MTKLRQIPAGEFKAKCLKLMDEVQRTKKPLVITKHGKAVARLVADEAEPADFFGCMEGTACAMEDIIAPLDVEWDANG